MLKVDNNNNYDYDQALGEKHTGWRQYIIPRSGVYIKVEIWHQEVDVGRQIAEQSLIVFDSN